MIEQGENGRILAFEVVAGENSEYAGERFENPLLYKAVKIAIAHDADEIFVLEHDDNSLERTCIDVLDVRTIEENVFKGFAYPAIMAHWEYIIGGHKGERLIEVSPDAYSVRYALIGEDDSNWDISTTLFYDAMNMAIDQGYDKIAVIEKRDNEESCWEVIEVKDELDKFYNVIAGEVINDVSYITYMSVTGRGLPHSFGNWDEDLGIPF